MFTKMPPQMRLGNESKTTNMASKGPTFGVKLHMFL